jgi:hypothetical protein
MKSSFVMTAAGPERGHAGVMNAVAERVKGPPPSLIQNFGILNRKGAKDTKTNKSLQ